MQPLDGVRVLDLTRLLPGAVCTMLLADMGADVIKVEDPNGGDYARWMPPKTGDTGTFFLSSNRNKRSIIIDLKQAAGLDAFMRLVTEADVLLEGFRPGVTDRLGVGAAAMCALNPRLIYCSLSGWGQSGPYAHESGHDLNYLSRSGAIGASRTPQPPGGQIADVGGAYAAALGIVAALHRRHTTGSGDVLDISLFEASLPFTFYQMVEGQAGGSGALTGGYAYYDVYTTQDNRHVALAALEPKFWRNFCDAVERPDLIPLHSQPEQQDTLRTQLTDLFTAKDAAEWDALLSDKDCCFSLVTTPDEVLNDPQIQARDTGGVDAGGVPWLRSPVRMQGSEPPSRQRPPQYGEHTRDVLRECGFSDDEIARLLDAGAVVQGNASGT